MNDEKDQHTSTFPTKGSEVSIDGYEYIGVVIWFGGNKSGAGKNHTKSYGFIEWSKDGVQQRDLFVHYSNIVAKEGTYRTLTKGQKVRFQIGTNHFGEPKAIFCSVVDA